MVTKFQQPRVVHCYQNSNPQRCLVRLYNKYLNLLPKVVKCTGLYVHGHHKPLPNCWFEDWPIGISSIRPIINHLCTLAGFTDGKFVNSSCCSSTCTRMFAKHQDEQIIQSVSGHKSNCVHMYKRLSDDIRRQASEAIQGPLIGKNVTGTDKGDTKKDSSADKFEGPKFEIRTPVKCKLEIQKKSEWWYKESLWFIERNHIQ